MGRSALLAMVVFSACPVPPANLDASTAIADPASEFCEARASASCAWEQRCGFSSAFACPTMPWNDCAAAERPLLREGVMSFDPDAGADCVAALAAQPCDYATSRDTPARCADVFVGTGQEGDNCGTCGAGLSCVLFTRNCGRCRPREPFAPLPGVGEECISPAVDGPGCARGLFCGGTTGSRGLCEPVAQAGEACETRVCKMGLNCKAADGGSTCQPRAELDEACASRFDCKAGLRCAAGVCKRTLAQGESCSTSDDCSSLRCFGGVCAALFVGLNESCLSVPCDPGLRCSSDGLCVAALAAGASCSDQICEAGASCEEGVCLNLTLSWCR